MFVTFRYRERDTLIQRLDPRTRLITLVCFLGAIIQFWDIRFLLVFFLIALLQYRLSGLTWQETRRFWMVIGPLIIFFTLVNSFFGRESQGLYSSAHVLWQGPTVSLGGISFTLRYTTEQLVFAASMFVRLFALALFSIIIPYTIHPAQYGIAFRQLGLPDKFSFAMDLAFRFVPSLGEDFSTTFDAQRARGYELERLGGGVGQQIRNLAPLVVPVTLRAILSGEEVVDAMDLRGFGSGPRTWTYELHYSTLDKVIIAASVLILVVSFVAAHAGYGLFYMPPFLQ